MFELIQTPIMTTAPMASERGAEPEVMPPLRGQIVVPAFDVAYAELDPEAEVVRAPPQDGSAPSPEEGLNEAEVKPMAVEEVTDPPAAMTQTRGAETTQQSIAFDAGQDRGGSHSGEDPEGGPKITPSPLVQAGDSVVAPLKGSSPTQWATDPVKEPELAARPQTRNTPVLREPMAIADLPLQSRANPTPTRSESGRSFLPAADHQPATRGDLSPISDKPALTWPETDVPLRMTPATVRTVGAPLAPQADRAISGGIAIRPGPPDSKIDGQMPLPDTANSALPTATARPRVRPDPPHAAGEDVTVHRLVGRSQADQTPKKAMLDTDFCKVEQRADTDRSASAIKPPVRAEHATLSREADTTPRTQRSSAGQSDEPLGSKDVIRPPSQAPDSSRIQPKSGLMQFTPETMSKTTTAPIGPDLAILTAGDGHPETEPLAPLGSETVRRVDGLHMTPELGRSGIPLRLPYDPVAEPRAIIRQLSTVASDPGSGQVEIHLNPAELGRVKMMLSVQDGALVVNLAMDRPETAELLRRHIDLLAQDFQDLGYSDPSFSFTEGNRSAEPAPGYPETDGAGNTTITDDPPASVAASLLAPDAASDHLDIRL